ncbi:hypothetical protein ACJ73_06191, partial [Blastomyces percursus]
QPVDATLMEKIPDEILEKIFLKIALDDAVGQSHIFLPLNVDPRSSLTLMLVCQKWHRIAEPILYRRLKYVCKPPITKEHAGSLLHLLDQKPYLSDYIRELFIYGPELVYCENSIDLQEQVFDEAVVKILPHCKRLKFLHLDRELLGPPSAVPTAIKNLPLTSLSITTVESSLLRNGFFNFLLGLRYLESLKIGLWASPSPITNVERLPADFRRQSNIKFLELQEANTYPTLTEDCLAFPAALEDILLTGFHFSRSTWHYSSDQIQALLLLHRDSLRRIRLSTISKQPGTSWPLPSFSSFPSLEQLFLCAFHVFNNEKPTDLYRKLSAPNLKLLILHYDLETSHYIGGEQFGEAQINYLEEFASVHSQTSLAKNFCELHIMFYACVEDSEDLSWPWDRLDRAAEIVLKHGIKLTYSPPHSSREEWEAEAKVIKERATRRECKEL